MNKIFVTLIFTSLSFLAFSQSNNKILGEWYTADKKAVVTIFAEGKTISGKTTWMEEPLDSKGIPKLDRENPDENLRSRKRLGLKIMQGFVYKEIMFGKTVEYISLLTVKHMVGRLH